MIPLGCHFDATLISFRFHFDVTSISLRCHFDVTSLSLWLHFNFRLISLGFHFDVTLISFRFYFDFTSISLRFHFDVTSISRRVHFNLTLASLKTLANHSENKGRAGPTPPGDQRHRGNQRNPKVHRKTKDSLSIPLRTHAGSTREAPSSRRTTFYLISQNKAEHQAQRARTHRPGPDH